MLGNLIRRKKEEGRRPNDCVYPEPFDFAQGKLRRRAQGTLQEERRRKKSYKILSSSELLNSLFSSFASFAPSRLNHSDTTGIDITPPKGAIQEESPRTLRHIDPSTEFILSEVEGRAGKASL
jgi:hypothetical protein